MITASPASEPVPADKREGLAMQTWMYVLICLSGPSCPTDQIVSREAYYSQESCEKDARLVAQGMFVSGQNKYGYRCELVDYEPPKVPK